MTALTPSNQASIARIWRGRTPPELADAYEAYSYQAGIKPLIEQALAVDVLREDREHETEFVTISYWQSVEAMRSFAGADPKAIHHLERDPEPSRQTTDSRSLDPTPVAADTGWDGPSTTRRLPTPAP
jgi:hypothetical protein